MSRQARIDIHLRKLLCAAAVLAVLLIALSVVGQISKHLFGNGRLFGIVAEFDLDAENNIPTYFSSVLLFLIAMTAAVTAQLERSVLSPWRKAWAGLAIVFLYLSLDEVASLHERSIAPLRHFLGVGGLLHFTWVIPGAVLLLVFLILYARFFLALPEKTRRLTALAGTLYVGGALGIELVGGRHEELFGHDFAYAIVTTFEESLEIAGILVLLYAFTGYLASRYPVIEMRLR